MLGLTVHGVTATSFCRHLVGQMHCSSTTS